MFDFIGKLIFKHTPEQIQSDDPQSVNTAMAENSPDVESLAVAQALVNHLNEILDWKDRIDAIDYLAASAAKSGGNPTYITTDETVINAIKVIGGSGNSVDFELAKVALDLTFNMMDVMALSALTGSNHA